MDLLDERLKKINKKNKLPLILSIIFLWLTIIFFGWAFYIQKSIKDDNISLHEMIASGSNEENKIVTLTVTEKPFVFAEYDSDSKSDKYYFLMDKDYLYVGYLDYDTYLKLNQIGTGDSITIKGITKTIPSDIVDIAIEVYNEELGKEFLTKGNYKNYIGSIYIDTVNSIYQDTIQIVLGCVFAIFFVVYFISYMIHNRNLNKFKKDTVLWGKIKTELDSSNIIEHSKLGLYLGKNMIIDYSKKLNILNYQDMAWVYLHENKYNGITNLRYLMVVLKNNKKIQIAYVGGFHPKLKEEYVKVMEEIYQHNQTILIGYTKENREQIKKLNKNK